MLSLFSALAIPQEPNQDAQCLAQAIYYEARGEPLKGKIAVAHVIINRTKEDNFPSEICAVIKQPGQFTWKSKVLKGVEFYSLAQDILEGRYDSYNLGALYFHNKTVQPLWNKTKVATIGNHVFYK